MRRKLIKFLLRLLGHNTDKLNVITIEVDADQALKTMKKIQYELEQIHKSIDKLPKGIVSLKDLKL